MKARLAVAIALIPFISSCKPKEQATTNAPPAPPHLLSIRASDYKFEAPDTTQSGLTRIQLIDAGPHLHHAQIVKIDSGRTFDSLMAAIRKPGPPPAWVSIFGGPNAGAPGDTTEIIQRLTPGHYAILCFIPDSLGRPHVALGMSKALEVVPNTARGTREPTADIEVKLTDYAFTESAALTAGTHTIKVTNDGPQPHEMFIARLDSGVTAAQMVAWIDHGMHGRPPAHPMGGFSALGPNQHGWVTITLAKGNYGLFCFVPDAKDGKEHTAHGMLKDIHVS